MNASGVLMEPLKISRGVKQGRPLSVALHVLVISPLIKRIINDNCTKGAHLGDARRTAALAYADGVTVIIKNRCEVDALTSLLFLHRQASRAKLNQDDAAGVWIGPE